MTRQAAAYRERRILLAGVNVSPSFRSPTKDNGEKRWPWRCKVRPRIIINRVQRSPAPNLMSGPERDLSKSVQQQSNIELRTMNTRADSGPLRTSLMPLRATGSIHGRCSRRASRHASAEGEVPRVFVAKVSGCGFAMNFARLLDDG